MIKKRKISTTKRLLKFFGFGKWHRRKTCKECKKRLITFGGNRYLFIRFEKWDHKCPDCSIQKSNTDISEQSSQNGICG